MRHRGSLMRLLLASPISLLVALGLLFVPVECSLAAGPHSIFIAANAVALLQEQRAEQHAGAHLHDHGAQEHTSSQHTMLGQPGTGSSAADVQPPLPKPASHHDHHGGAKSAENTCLVPSTTPPSTAEIVSYGMVAMLLPGLDAESQAIAPFLCPLIDLRIPPEHLLPGPEPPPP